MGSGLSRESSPESPAVVHAATPLTAYESTDAPAHTTTTTTTTRPSVPVNAPAHAAAAEALVALTVPVPPPVEPETANPRQRMAQRAAPEAGGAEINMEAASAAAEASEVASESSVRRAEEEAMPPAVAATAVEDAEDAEDRHDKAAEPMPVEDPENPLHDSKTLPEAMPSLALPADTTEVSLSSPSPSVSPPTSHIADADDNDDNNKADAGPEKAPEDATSPRDSPHPLMGEDLADLADHGTAAVHGTSYRPLARSVSPAAGLEQYAQLPLHTVQSTLKTNHRVLRICLTGGPCAGKSTMLAQFQAKLPQRLGCDVYCVPEAATMLVTGGMQWSGDLIVEQQTALLRTQLALEDQFYALAVATGHPSIIFSDRGTMDGRAFCSEAQFTEILRRLGCTLEALRDRYDAVIHMVTSAIGAEAYYNLDNPARYEDLDGARESDLKLRQMYVGHPYFRLLDNSSSFDDKIEKGLRLAAQIAGADVSDAEQPVTYHYLLRRACPLPLPVPCASFTLTTTILSNSRMDEIRLLFQRQMPDGSCMHFFRSLYKPSTAALAGVPPPPLPGSARQESGYRRRSHSGSHSTTASSASVPPSTTSTAHHHAHRKSIGGWSANGSTTSTAITHACSPQSRIDTCQRISSKEYVSLLNHRDPMREDVVVESTQFFHNSVSLELITILAPSWAAGKQTMTVESTEAAMATLTFPSFVDVDREVPVDTSTTAFLISHRETGPLYTSLAFAPVFTRTVTALGAHADVHDFEATTCDSSMVQRAASELNTPLRPLQSLRQNSMHGGSSKGSKGSKGSFSDASSATTAQLRSRLQNASPSDAREQAGTAAISAAASVPTDKENAMPRRLSQRSSQPQVQAQRTPLAPVPLFPARTHSFRTPSAVQETAHGSAKEAVVTAPSVEGGELPEREDAPQPVPSAKSVSLTPLQQVVLPAIGERFPVSPTPAAA